MDNVDIQDSSYVGIEDCEPVAPITFLIWPHLIRIQVCKHIANVVERRRRARSSHLRGSSRIRHRLRLLRGTRVAQRAAIVAWLAGTWGSNLRLRSVPCIYTSAFDAHSKDYLVPVNICLTIHHRRLRIVSLVRTRLQALLRLGHLVGRWALLLLLILRGWHQARVTLPRRVCHDATKQVAWTVTNRWRRRL